MVATRNEKWIVLTGFACLLAAVGFLVRQWRYEAAWWDAVREMHAASNRLKNVALALELYHEDHGAYPPAVVRAEDGTPQHSWRVLLLPYMGGDEFYARYRFDEPWNGPHNRTLNGRDPSESFAASTDSVHLMTDIVAVVGKGTMWPADGSRISHDDFSDGLAATITVVEIGNSDIPWMEPRDLSMRDVGRLDAQRAKNVVGANRWLPGRWFWQEPTPVVLAVTADGTGRVIPRILDVRTWQSLLTIDGGEQVPLPTLDPQRLPIAAR